jgi:hypothetical protein
VTVAVDGREGKGQLHRYGGRSRILHSLS